MTKQELLNTLRAATGPSRQLDAEVAFATGYFDWKLQWFPNCRIERGERLVYYEPLPAFTSSLDAANAFRERELPGWQWQVWGYGAAKVFKATVGEYYQPAVTPAIALCAAVIAALIAQETSRENNL